MRPPRVSESRRRKLSFRLNPGPEPTHVTPLEPFLTLPAGEPYTCPYLSGRLATYESFISDWLHPEIYHELMDRGFRRSGRIFYRDRCIGCRECRPIRVPSWRLKHTKSQRRIWRRNTDLHVTIGPPVCTVAKWNLFSAYLRCQHDGRMIEHFDEFEAFLYQSPVDTIEICYYAGRSLIGVSIADRCRRSLSSVYHYFDPQERRRSLGTYSALWEIDFCRRKDIPWYYLGLFVRDADTMNYKLQFQPCEILSPDGAWTPGERLHL